jgi:putative ABC transport system permease protein
MKLAIKLAYRNLIGAGLRTWLNVLVLSFSFVVIIWLNGVMKGWDYQAKNDMTHYEIGGGQYWHQDYDPFRSVFPGRKPRTRSGSFQERD